MLKYENGKNQFEKEINKTIDIAILKRGNIIVSVMALKSIYDSLSENKQIENENQFYIIFQNLKKLEV